MGAKQAGTEATTCAERLRTIQRLLFGRTLGNKYRAEVAAIRKDSPEQFKLAVRNTRAVLIDSVFEDQTLATLSLARMARERPHAAFIFLSLECANLCLMNPKMTTHHDELAKELSRTQDNPVAIVIRCLEYLSG